MPAKPSPSLEQLLDRGAPRSPDRDTLDAWGRAVGAALPRPVVITLSAPDALFEYALASTAAHVAH